MRQDVDDRDAVLLAAHRGDGMPQDYLFLAVVPGGVELKLRELLRIVDRPAAEGAGDGDHVVLGVATVDAERVELQQLSPVILVQPRAADTRWNRQVVARH